MLLGQWLRSFLCFLFAESKSGADDEPFDLHFTDYNSSNKSEEDKEQHVSNLFVSLRRQVNISTKVFRPKWVQKDPKRLSDLTWAGGDTPDLLSWGVQPEEVDFYHHFTVLGSMKWRNMIYAEKVMTTKFIDLGLFSIDDNFMVTPVDTLVVAKQKRPQCPVQLVDAQTQYQHVDIFQLGDAYWLNHNGVIQFHSKEWEFTHSALTLPVVAAQHVDRVLILGGGDGLAAATVLRYPEVGSIINMELDPDMIDLTRSNPVLRRISRGSFRHPKVRPLAQDAVAFIRDTDQTFDVIIDDCDYRNTDQPAPVLSDEMVEYYRNIHRHLTPGGVASTMMELDIFNFFTCLRIEMALQAKEENRKIKIPSEASVRHMNDKRFKKTFDGMAKTLGLPVENWHDSMIACWRKFFQRIVNATAYVEMPTIYLGTELHIIWGSLESTDILKRKRPLPPRFLFDEQRVDRIFAGQP